MLLFHNILSAVTAPEEETHSISIMGYMGGALKSAIWNNMKEIRERIILLIISSVVVVVSFFMISVNLITSPHSSAGTTVEQRQSDQGSSSSSSLCIHGATQFTFGAEFLIISNVRQARGGGVGGGYRPPVAPYIHIG